MSRILVTGINSPLGQAVGRKLQVEGHRVVGTVRSSKIKLQDLPVDELATLDLENEATFTNIVGSFDSFVHVAGMSTGSATEMMISTGLGTHHLITRAKELLLPRFIHISSMAVYGLGTEELIGESSPTPHGNRSADRRKIAHPTWQRVPCSEVGSRVLFIKRAWTS